MVLVAFVAVTVHVPGVLAFSTLPLEMEHPAEPAEVTANVTAPVPDPPEVVSVRVEPYVLLVDVIDSEDCEALDIVSVAVEDVSAVDNAPLNVFVTMTLKEPASVRANGLMVYELEFAPEIETPPLSH